MISMDEGDDKKLASCFVENGIMEIVKVRALRTTLIHLDGFKSKIGTSSGPILGTNHSGMVRGALMKAQKKYTGREEIGTFASFIKEKFPCAQHWEGNVCVKFTDE